ncbi:cupin domain-containing protein [Paracoccus pantotrophus]|uniref:cupin domain-containing protein n=1 Tax=Paracoccus pantotrophus TaxID=82367 RepID=UPI00048CA04B|nr:cupin domain-containing protein [Paracoccus pantotrophus]
MNTENSDSELRIGERLRILRERAGLSQRALAKRAKVTNATISLVEADKMNPSVGALRRILDGIPISLSEFFAFEPEPEQTIFYEAAELSEVGKGKVSFRRIGQSQFGRAMTILHERYEPGADTGRVMYQHEGEEGGVVISGRIEITVGEERRILGPGDAYYFDSRKPHRFRQVGAEPCVIVSACTPPTF